MEQIKIKCTSGFTIPLDEMVLFTGKLKKHSLLEIERVVDSITNDGFLFPIAISKVNGKNLIIDGECRYKALNELKNRGYEIPEIPIFYVKSNEETLIRNTLIATSTNHVVTKSSLEEFCKDTQFGELIKELAFNEGLLIDFWTEEDLKRDFEKFMISRPKNVATVEDYEKLVMDGII